MRMIPALLALLLAATAPQARILAAPPTAEAPLPAEDVTRFVLDNGFEIVVIEDHRAPVVTTMVWYRVGSADDPRGKSGLAHYLEHLMFSGTREVGYREYRKLIQANGGTSNAFTSWDYTAYLAEVAADRLDLVLRLEADRMVNLVLTEDTARRELAVVQEERASRVAANPSALFGERQSATLFTHSPKGVPIIGWPAEIATLTHEDALAFYRRHYAPDNAILVVAGDVVPAEVRALAQTHFGPLEPSGNPRDARPLEPEPLTARRIAMEDARVSRPFLVRDYLAPSRVSGDQDAAAATFALSQLLRGSGRGSHLFRRLQLDATTASSTAVSYDPTGLNEKPFSIYVVPAEGVTLAEAEAALDEALAAFLKDGPEPGALERFRERIVAWQIYDLDNRGSRANRYGGALATGLTVEDVADWPARLQAVTEADVMEAARALLRPENSVTGTLTGTGKDS